MYTYIYIYILAFAEQAARDTRVCKKQKGFTIKKKEKGKGFTIF
jgi:hypothetical protein